MKAPAWVSGLAALLSLAAPGATAAAERDGAVVFSHKVMSGYYAYPRTSPGALSVPAPVAVFQYGYAPEYGLSYRLAPPITPATVCYAEPQMLYNTGGVFIGYSDAIRCR